MDDRPVIWDRANRKHIVEDRPERQITIAEVEETLTDKKRDEAPDPKRPGATGSSAAAPRLGGAWWSRGWSTAMAAIQSMHMR